MRYDLTNYDSSLNWYIIVSGRWTKKEAKERGEPDAPDIGTYRDANLDVHNSRG
jgi:hypothetical protein